MIEKARSNAVDATGDIHEQEKLLKSLRQVNEDDTLSRVLCADLPATRATGDESAFSGSPGSLNLNEEVTLCGASHVETKMAECISDGIEAPDIGSLLEQFLEYEKGISPAMSPAGSSSSQTPVSLPNKKNKSAKSNVRKVHSSAKAKKVQASPLDEPIKEIADLDLFVDNQITISTTSEEDSVTTSSNDISGAVSAGNGGASDVEKEGKQDCFIVNRNGIVVVEYRSVSAKNDPKQKCKVEVNGNIVEKTNNDQNDKADVGMELEDDVSKKEIEVQDKETAVNDRSSNDSITNGSGGITYNGNQHDMLNAKLRSVIGQSYVIPKNSTDSKNRARSRSPLTRSSTRSYESLKSRSYSSSSDEDEDRRERYERYKSERRTPMRRDDRRKRRKYSSCSDDEYDYYRYSKRGSRGSFRDQSPRRSHYDHDYNKPRTHYRDFHRSSSVRERGEREYSSSRRSSQKERRDSDDNVHERLSDLAKPVPYDIEHERKIGFLVKESGTSSYERRNVYAGGIQKNVTKRDLIRRFECFGPVEKVTLHFREKGDNYAFVIFEDAKDAIKAVIEGNNDPNYEPLDLCFGGRRRFVGGSYVDFDANISYLEENELTYSKPASPVEDLEFDTLLEMAKRQQSVE